MNNYFSHDSNARNSDKLLPVRMRYGAEGYGIYFMLLERLRDEKNYMSFKDYNVLAFELRVDTSILKSIIEDFGLFAFTDDGECFYSEGFLKRMEMKDEKSAKLSEAGKRGAAKRWQSDSQAIATPMAIDSKESKGKKSKYKNTPPTALAKSDVEADFEKLWALFPRKERKADALKAYKKALKAGVTNKEIQSGIVAYTNSVAGKEPQFIAQGGTWFNQQRWNDEYAPNVPAPTGTQYTDMSEVLKSYEQ